MTDDHPLNATELDGIEIPDDAPKSGVVRHLLRNRRAAFGLGLLALVALAAALADVVAVHDPQVQVLANRYRPPGAEHWMGTDAFGRDAFSRVLHASRISLLIGVASVAISIVVSVVVGAVAGFYGRWVDNVLMRVTDVIIVIPTILLLIAIVAAYGNSLILLILVIGLTSWPVGARIVRGEVMALKHREYVDAARAMGAGDMRLLLRHILPGVMSVIIVSATIRVPFNILLEAALSYLGLGVQPPTASWGNMIGGATSVLLTAWWVALFPGLFLLVTVLGFNLVGDGLRDALDPRMRSNEEVA